MDFNTVGKLSYIKYLEELTQQVNKNHNPFRSIVNRLAYFLKHNNVTSAELISRITKDSLGKISVAKFAEFLKQKVDKKTEFQLLQRLSVRIDID